MADFVSWHFEWLYFAPTVKSSLDSNVRHLVNIVDVKLRYLLRIKLYFARATTNYTSLTTLNLHAPLRYWHGLNTDCSGCVHRQTISNILLFCFSWKFFCVALLCWRNAAERRWKRKSMCPSMMHTKCQYRNRQPITWICLLTQCCGLRHSREQRVVYVCVTLKFA